MSERWARDWETCRRCKSIRLAHKARGYCVHCYGFLYRGEQLAGTQPWAWQVEWQGDQRQADIEVDETEAYLAYEYALWLLWHVETHYPVRVAA